MKRYIPDDAHSQGGRRILTRNGFGVSLVVSGDVKVYPVEQAGAGAIEFAEPVREVIVIATGAGVYAAASADALAATGTGATTQARWLVPAGHTRSFPLWGDTLHVDGACYVEGRL